MARPGYPNFGGTIKFVEAHGRNSTESAATLAVAHGRSNFARENDNLPELNRLNLKD